MGIHFKNEEWELKVFLFVKYVVNTHKLVNVQLLVVGTGG